MLLAGFTLECAARRGLRVLIHTCMWSAVLQWYGKRSRLSIQIVQHHPQWTTDSEPCAALPPPQALSTSIQLLQLTQALAPTDRHSWPTAVPSQHVRWPLIGNWWPTWCFHARGWRKSSLTNKLEAAADCQFHTKLCFIALSVRLPLLGL